MPRSLVVSYWHYRWMMFSVGTGFNSVSATPAFDYLDAPMRRLAGADVPIPYNRNLERAAVPQEEDIEREIRAIVGNKY